MDTQTIHGLNIPAALREINPDEKVINAVIADITTLRQDPQAITARQQEMADVIAHPDLLHILQRQADQLEAMKSRHNAERLSAAKSRVYQNDAKNRLHPVIDNLYFIAKQAEECVKIYIDLPVHLRDMPFTSDFFNGFKNKLVKITAADTQQRLKSFVKDMQTLSSAAAQKQANITVAYTMHETFDKVSYRITRLLFDKTPASIGKGFWLHQRDNVLKLLRRNEMRRREDEFNEAEAFFSHSLAGGFTRLIDLLTQFIRNLQKPFDYIMQHLYVFKFGLSLAANCRAKGVACHFPIIAIPGQHGSPLPLTVRFAGDDGDSFTFVQHQALAQLLAQAGFPLPEYLHGGQNTPISVVSGIFAQFASSELILGRFEEEAREMASLCRNIKPHGLVFFHEVFQSTAYEDIAEPFAQIVEFLLGLPCTVVVVTHNWGLVGRLG
jgi:DNA mismatch repair ATPase MutS